MAFLMGILTALLFIATIPLRMARLVVSTHLKAMETEGKIRTKKKKKQAKKQGKVAQKKASIKSKVSNLKPKQRKIKDLPKIRQLSYRALRLVRKGLSTAILFLQTLASVSMIITLIVVLIVIALIIVIITCAAGVFTLLFGDNKVTIDVNAVRNQTAQTQTSKSNSPEITGKKLKNLRYPKRGANITIPLMLQGRPSPWAGDSITSAGTYGGSGCGLTSMAMILSYMCKKQITPPDVVNALKNANRLGEVYCGAMYTSGSGVIFEVFCKKYKNLKNEWKRVEVKTKADLKKHAEAYHPIIMLMRGHNKGSRTAENRQVFTKGGHFIVIRGAENNKYYVNDPNATGNSARYGQSRDWWDNHGWSLDLIWRERCTDAGSQWAFVPK